MLEFLKKEGYVTTGYKEGQNADQTLDGNYQSIDECRADSTALYLSWYIRIVQR